MFYYTVLLELKSIFLVLINKYQCPVTMCINSMYRYWRKEEGIYIEILFNMYIYHNINSFILSVYKVFTTPPPPHPIMYNFSWLSPLPLSLQHGGLHRSSSRYHPIKKEVQGVCLPGRGTQYRCPGPSWEGGGGLLWRESQRRWHHDGDLH